MFEDFIINAFSLKQQSVKMLNILITIWCVISVASCNHLQQEDCPAREVRCSNTAHLEELVLGFYCIDVYYVCNGMEDCPDGSDEVGCEEYTCPEGTLPCDSGRISCYHEDRRCDGFGQCMDRSDEAGCEDFACFDSQFSCQNDDPTSTSKCTPLDQVCNGYIYCRNGRDEDEDVCGDWTCPDDKFMCMTTGRRPRMKCVNSERRCDGFVDCVDNSDEELEMCEEYECQEDQLKCDVENRCLYDVRYWTDGQSIKDCCILATLYTCLLRKK